MSTTTTTRFLGRVWCPLTATYRFEDGSGEAITAERRQLIAEAAEPSRSPPLDRNGPRVLAAIFERRQP